MRRLFYRFSDTAVYYRYFSPIRTMPHRKMQEYVNVDYQRIMSIVGTVDKAGTERIIAEGRYVRHHNRPLADVAFVVDENYQGRGIASFLFEMLIRVAREQGIEGFTADVIADNKAMLKVFEKAPFPIRAVMESGIYNLTIPFDDAGNPPHLRHSARGMSIVPKSRLNSVLRRVSTLSLPVLSLFWAGRKNMKNTCKWIVCLFCMIAAVQPLWAKDKTIVAVLPFTVHSAENIDYVRQGIGDMLSSRISVNEKIEVISREVTLAALKETGGKELDPG